MKGFIIKMKKKIYVYFLIIIILLIIILLIGNMLFNEILSSEKSIIVTNQSSSIIIKIKKCFDIKEDIKKIEYYDDFNGYSLSIYDINNNRKYIHVERPTFSEQEIEAYFSNLKKEYNKCNIIVLIFSILLEIYIIDKTIDLFRK